MFTSVNFAQWLQPYMYMSIMSLLAERSPAVFKTLHWKSRVHVCQAFDRQKTVRYVTL